MQGMKVQSLVGELRSHMPCGQKKKKKKKNKVRIRKEKSCTIQFPLVYKRMQGVVYIVQEMHDLCHLLQDLETFKCLLPPTILVTPPDLGTSFSRLYS